MPTAADRLAFEHAVARQRLTAAAVIAAIRAWARIDQEAIAGSWVALTIGLTAAVTGAQRRAAQRAEAFVDDALARQGTSIPPQGALNVGLFAGIASDGRPLQTLLALPAFSALRSIATGRDPVDALRGGRHQLAVLVATQVADAGRTADAVSIVSRPGAGYVRQLVGPSCVRCVALAGRRYRSLDPFARHLGCDCIHVPIPPNPAGDPRPTEAIRSGGDTDQVFDTDRDLVPAGTVAPRSAPSRLTPDRIFELAGGDRDLAMSLLREHEFIT